MDQINDIDLLYRNLNNEITTLQNLYDSAKNNWKGPASDEFLRSLYKLISDMKITRGELSQLSDSMSDAAFKLKQMRDSSSVGGGGGSVGGR